MSDIIDLREISPHNWQAKYQGNYGVYTIKITTDGKQIGRFSCSCPSSASPCKHIGMIQAAIVERIAEIHGSVAAPGVGIAELLQDISRKELYNFIVRQAQYNPDFTNAILLEFAHTIESEENQYSLIVRQGFKDLHIDLYEYHDEDILFDILDQWLEKAQAHLAEQNYAEVVLICKACIEEFAAWLEQEDDGDLIDYTSYYQDMCFKILKEAVVHPEVNAQEFFDYCMTEMKKEKYADTGFFDCFNDVLLYVAGVNPDAFIRLQDTLLSELKDTNGYNAEKIVQREINFYRDTNQPEKAWKLIEEHVQIASFCKELVKRYIAEAHFTEAKALIHEYIAHQEVNSYRNSQDEWDELLLEIAQKEQDVPTIRKLSFGFIECDFKENYFSIYKSTFSAEEWADALEDLVRHYEKHTDRFDAPIPKLFAAEHAAERLLTYIETHLDLEMLTQYHTVFAGLFPEKTLTLFRQALDRYVAVNTGRTYYERIVACLEKMLTIKDGTALVITMVNAYKFQYKNRSAMIETLDRFAHEHHLQIMPTMKKKK
ncbi:MAG: hypothetical protein LBT13_05575 [Treponema sp.]|jgi:cell fate (sporulation/competence/biofilm development) regulator YlbF (YheA/YmcA/DUF963 family)|nr:hypothetical protein [Treponema sp.]